MKQVPLLSLSELMKSRIDGEMKWKETPHLIVNWMNLSNWLQKSSPFPKYHSNPIPLNFRTLTCIPCLLAYLLLRILSLLLCWNWSRNIGKNHKPRQIHQSCWILWILWIDGNELMWLQQMIITEETPLKNYVRLLRECRKNSENTSM